MGRYSFIYRSTKRYGEAADGERDLVGIPVFPSRAFRHSCISVNTDIIKDASDLNGKRIGVQIYTHDRGCMDPRGFARSGGSCPQSHGLKVR